MLAFMCAPSVTVNVGGRCVHYKPEPYACTAEPCGVAGLRYVYFSIGIHT